MPFEFNWMKHFFILVISKAIVKKTHLLFDLWWDYLICFLGLINQFWIQRSIVGHLLYCGGVISPYMLDLIFNNYDVDKEYLYNQLELFV
jgi:hypothetical protein